MPTQHVAIHAAIGPTYSASVPQNTILDPEVLKLKIGTSITSAPEKIHANSVFELGAMQNGTDGRTGKNGNAAC